MKLQRLTFALLLLTAHGCASSTGDDDGDDSVAEPTPTLEPTSTPANTATDAPTPSPTPDENPSPTPAECVRIEPFNVCQFWAELVGDPAVVHVTGLVNVQEETPLQLCAWGGLAEDPYRAFSCSSNLVYPLRLNYPYYFDINTGYSGATAADIGFVLCTALSSTDPQPTCYP